MAITRKLAPRLIKSYAFSTDLTLGKNDPATLEQKLHMDNVNGLLDPNWDPLLEHVTPHLESLARIAKSCNPLTIEGHIYATEFIERRRTLFLLGVSRNNILEIGFNLGFSSLLMLSANPRLRLHAVDIGVHSYVRPCFEYLRKIFPGRVQLSIGNSTIQLPKILSAEREFDGFHIDGSHDMDIAAADLENVISRAQRGALIVFDDTDRRDLSLLLTRKILTGQINRLQDEFFLKNIGSTVLIKL
jgi:hypothetical protein